MRLAAKLQRLGRAPLAPAAPLPPRGPFADLRREETALGPVWIRREVHPLADKVGCGSFAAAMNASPACLAALDGLPGGRPAPLPACDLVFLDTETTGLQGGAGTVPFLVGLAWFVNDTLVLEQFFLPRLGGERAILALVTRRLAGKAALVSYNGKSFDWPLLRTRYVLAGMEAPQLGRHLDLVHVCRRLVRAAPSYRLQAMEERLLGYSREGDFPGALVPEAYFAYLRGGSEGAMEQVLRHNAEDILALVALLGVLAPRLADDGHSRLAACEQFAVAKVLLRHGERDRALAVAGAALARAEAADAVAMALFCAELWAAGKEPEQGIRPLEHALLRGARQTPAKVAAQAHLWLSKRYQTCPANLPRALVHAAKTFPAETLLAQQARQARLRLRLRSSNNKAGPSVKPTAGQASDVDVPLVEQNYRHRLASPWAPVQKVGLLSTNAQKRVLHPLSRNQNVVRENCDPGAGIAVPGTLAAGEVEAP